MMLQSVVKEYLQKYSDEIVDLFMKLRSIIYESMSAEIQETLWAKLSSYYIGESLFE